MAKAKAMAKLRRQMKSHGPVVHNENVGGGANGTIDGGAGDSSSTNGDSWISFSNTQLSSHCLSVTILQKPEEKVNVGYIFCYMQCNTI